MKKNYKTTRIKALVRTQLCDNSHRSICDPWARVNCLYSICVPDLKSIFATYWCTCSSKICHDVITQGWERGTAKISSLPAITEMSFFQSLPWKCRPNPFQTFWVMQHKNTQTHTDTQNDHILPPFSVQCSCGQEQTNEFSPKDVPE